MTVAISPRSITAAAIRVEWRSLAAMDSVLPAWHALASRATEPNVFYEPAFARAALPLFGTGVGAGLVWLQDKLIGMFPARVERRYGIPPAVLTGWTHPYAPLGTPLIDRDDGAVALNAWLDHLAKDGALPKLWLLPYLADGAFARSLDATLAIRNARSAVFGRHRRAQLLPGDRAAYLARAVSSKRRKELRRQRHRLEEAGAVATNVVTDPSAIDAALGDFLALEAAGWKGRAGTAANSGSARHFMMAAVAELAAEGKARIDRLTVADKAVAVAVTLRSGDTAWTWKIAYDEAHARTSPGVQLMLDLTESMLADSAIARADSCATEGHPMIDHLWRERLAVGDHLVAVGAGAMTFAMACRLEGARRSAMAAAKRLRDRLRSSGH